MIDSVSACFVVYNEAHRIEDTIKNISPHVDEICVVDQQSDDGTWEWLLDNASAYNMQIAQDKHHGYCEPSRAYCHSLSSCDWILVLDADERISDDFIRDMRIVTHNGVRLKRSLWLSGAHHFTGDYQYRYFRRDCVKYLDEIHTEPQPTIPEHEIWSPPYVGIFHEKSWTEQVRDERSYQSIISVGDPGAIGKLALNVHLKVLQETGLEAEEIDSLSVEARKEMFNLPEFEG